MSELRLTKFFGCALFAVLGTIVAGTYNSHDYTMTTDSHITYNEEIIELPDVSANEIMEEQIEEAIQEDMQFVEDMLIAKQVQAEAGGEPLVGRVAVAATIFNRAESYNLSIPEVLAKGYCKPASYATEETIEAVRIARENRDLFPRNMMYFRTECYHTFQHSKDYTIIGNHYFSLNDLYDPKTGERI